MKANIARFSQSTNEEVQLCPLCNSCLETLPHLFLGCDIAIVIWRNADWPINIDGFKDFPVSFWVKVFLNPHKFLTIPKKDNWKFQIYVVVVMDLLWFSRNQVVHN